MDPRLARTFVWIALAVPLVMDAVYFSLVRAQNAYPPDVFTVPFVATYLLAMVVMLWVSLLRRLDPALRTALRGGAAAGLATLGVFAMFSIGAPILIAGVLAAVALGTSIDRSRWQRSLLAGVIAAVICVSTLVLGLDFVNRIIICSPTGTESGAGNGIVLGPYSYQCSGGEVHWNSG